MNYLPLTAIQKKPLSLSGDGPVQLIIEGVLTKNVFQISLTIARSRYLSDVFDNYFVVDGDLDNPKSIKRFEDVVLSNFNTSSNIITLVGLDDTVSHSSFILNPTSQLNGFSKFVGITVDGLTTNINVDASNGRKVGVMIVSKEIQQLVLNKMELGDSENCKAVAVTGPPTSDSKTLIDFKTDQYSLPQLFPYPYFSVIVENCNAQFNLTNSLPSNYYNLEDDRSGFIFSPMYFNDEATNGYMNITFAYKGDQKRQFVVDVDRVMLGTANSQLDINIYDSNWEKTLSAVITGNQEGTRSRAFGSYLNVQMYGNTAARLHWSLTSSSQAFLNLVSIILVAAIMNMISD
ncbi:hypothetical protein CAEBREN_31334 [Caenorhabditis brenneri]|uniref:CUB-like domain-containing protein n=1 Tax=Caenorhabditis brenneri TaxID=135651 RepID=G0PHX0_CAEBE|nr:hypothetical protein CAEBREN_31334 [Caenorhabditis brenneri]